MADFNDAFHKTLLRLSALPDFFFLSLVSCRNSPLFRPPRFGGVFHAQRDMTDSKQHRHHRKRDIAEQKAVKQKHCRRNLRQRSSLDDGGFFAKQQPKKSIRNQTSSVPDRHGRLCPIKPTDMTDDRKMKYGKSKAAESPALFDYLNGPVVKTVFKRLPVKNSVQNRWGHEQNSGDKSAKVKPIHIEDSFSRRFAPRRGAVSTSLANSGAAVSIGGYETDSDYLDFSLLLSYTQKRLLSI